MVPKAWNMNATACKTWWEIQEREGLIPVKYLGVEQGVNITVGLPFVRTSVDHGTAFDIAGTGSADHASLPPAHTSGTAVLTASACPSPA